MLGLKPVDLDYVPKRKSVKPQSSGESGTAEDEEQQFEEGDSDEIVD